MLTSQKLLRWSGVAVVAVAAITLVASTAMPRHPDTPAEIVVEVSDAGTGPVSDCSAAKYRSSFFDGATVTLGADGTDLAEAAFGGDGTSSARGCSWSVTFDDVAVAEEYSVTLRSPVSQRREHAYRYAAADLAERDGRLWISVVA